MRGRIVAISETGMITLIAEIKKPRRKATPSRFLGGQGGAEALAVHASAPHAPHPPQPVPGTPTLPTHLTLPDSAPPTREYFRLPALAVLIRSCGKVSLRCRDPRKQSLGPATAVQAAVNPYFSSHHPTLRNSHFSGKGLSPSRR